jgi:hypothetical protein
VNTSDPIACLLTHGFAFLGLAFSVIFVMAALCRRPFGNKFVLRTPALLLGISPPYEDASSLGFKLHTAPLDAIGEDNV